MTSEPKISSYDDGIVTALVNGLESEADLGGHKVNRLDVTVRVAMSRDNVRRYETGLALYGDMDENKRLLNSAVEAAVGSVRPYLSRPTELVPKEAQQGYLEKFGRELEGMILSATGISLSNHNKIGVRQHEEAV